MLKQNLFISIHIYGFFIKVQKYENYYIPPSFHRHFQPKKSPSKPGNVELRYFLHFSNTKKGDFLHFSNGKTRCFLHFSNTKQGDYLHFSNIKPFPAPTVSASSKQTRQ